MGCDVAAGKKAVAKLNIKSSILSKYDITDIRCVDILFWAYDEDKHYKEFDTGQKEIKTNLYDNSHNTFVGDAIYADNGITVNYLKQDGNDVYFCISNATGKYFNYDFTEITINGFTVTDVDYDLYNEVILDKCCTVCTVQVSKSFMSETEIDDVTSVEWNMSIRPYGDYFDEYKIGPIEYIIGQ